MRFLRALFRGSSPTPFAERRASARARTRLRPGKLLHETGAFLADCMVVERSGAGMRVRSFGPPGAPGDVVVLFDEKDAVLRPGRVVWTRGPEAGIRLESPAVAPDAATLRRIAGPYYAVGE